ncbi:phage tail assembly chaperone [Bosea sp. ANAM02]|uniref:phage tail assembly chaperone n=1 Tax=Bosea sp. ANAM02 TaxID=2020412 RepID=UPI0032AF1D8E
MPPSAAAGIGAPAGFPWDEVMAFGLGRLAWPPERFWAATPREIAAALRAYQDRSRASAPERPALAALMAAFPDA